MNRFYSMRVIHYVRRIVEVMAPNSFLNYKEVSIVSCEQRLAFSAVPFADVMQDMLATCDMSPPEPFHVSEPVAIHTADSLNTCDLFPADSHLGNDSLQSFGAVAQNTAAHALTGLTAAKSLYGLYGAGQTVAIIDTGIAYDHEALGQGLGSNYRVVGGYDFAENDSNPYDDGPAGYHGTGVAGVVGGSATGVAPGVDFVALRVFDDYRRGTLNYVESALRWVHDNRNAFENPITIVNMSLGVDFNTTTPPSEIAILEDELQALRNDGILVIASAGNAFAKYQTPGLAYPASSSLVLPVSSVDSNGSLSDFSQRDHDALAAPGRQITSTVPDFMLGSDGNSNDYTQMSGTSFSAPYVAGASALIREAFEIVGIENASVDMVRQTLFNTADSIYDSITNASYSRLNIQRALDSILPDDNVGNAPNSAMQFNPSGALAGRFDGFINQLGDKDAYHWTATESGTLELDFTSSRLTDSKWLLWNGSEQSQLSANGKLMVEVQAGHTYDFGVVDVDQIGAYSISWSFESDVPTQGGSNTQPVELGTVAVDSMDVNQGGVYAMEASRDGVLSLQLSNFGSQGLLRVFDSNGHLIQADAVAENGMLRIDFGAQESTRYLIQTSFNSNSARLDIANLINVVAYEVKVYGTDASDSINLDLSQGVRLDVGAIQYQFTTSAINSISIDQRGSADQISINGNQQIQTVYMYSDHGRLNTAGLSIEWKGSEQVEFIGSGGADRVYAFDTDGNDVLTINPNRFQLDGAGYQFVVSNVERLFIDASRGGNDIAYMWDSEGDDYLSIRPQFSSLRGDGFFNYVTGFERVYAYATQGGQDSATLYDSAGNDTYSTSGETAAIVGNNYHSYTKYFENVESIASSGGNDVATIYSPQNAVSTVGSDFVSFQYNQWQRTARGFATVQSTVLQSAATNAASFDVDETARAYSDDASGQMSSVSQAWTAEPTKKNVETDNLDMPSLGGDVMTTSWESIESNLQLSSEPSFVSERSSNETGWFSESRYELYRSRMIDPLTLELMCKESEAASLLRFFEEIANLSDESGISTTDKHLAG